VVPSERLECKPSEVCEIAGCGVVVDYYVIERTDPIPAGLFLLAIGKVPDKVWEHFSKSDKLIFYICKPN
jgi:hypothetical protein